MTSAAITMCARPGRLLARGRDPRPKFYLTPLMHDGVWSRQGRPSPPARSRLPSQQHQAHDDTPDAEE